ncbi:hypothetical protein [Pseudoalteromonas rubra]|nr:hypothetical protein [Pseudoalteromonas rubra]
MAKQQKPKAKEENKFKVETIIDLKITEAVTGSGIVEQPIFIGQPN